MDLSKQQTEEDYAFPPNTLTLNITNLTTNKFPIFYNTLNSLTRVTILKKQSINQSQSTNELSIPKYIFCTLPLKLPSTLHQNSRKGQIYIYKTKKDLIRWTYYHPLEFGRHPLDLGRFIILTSDTPPLLILSYPLDLGRPFSADRPGRPNSGPGFSSFGTNPGRRWGGTNLSGFGEITTSLSLSWFKAEDERDEPVPVRPKGRSEIASGPGSDRGRWSWSCWVCWDGFGCWGGWSGLGVDRVRTNMRPWDLLGAEMAE